MVKEEFTDTDGKTYRKAYGFWYERQPENGVFIIVSYQNLENQKIQQRFERSQGLEDKLTFVFPGRINGKGYALKGGEVVYEVWPLPARTKDDKDSRPILEALGFKILKSPEGGFDDIYTVQAPEDLVCEDDTLYGQIYIKDKNGKELLDLKQPSHWLYDWNSALTLTKDGERFVMEKHKSESGTKPNLVAQN